MGFIGRAVAPAPITASDVPDLPASKITTGTFADARISASNVSQHATSFDDNNIINDLSTLGLRVHTQENLNASNTNSASFDVFQDSSGITNLTNVDRTSEEFLASVYEITESGGTSTGFGAISGWSWSGSVFTHNSTNYIEYNTTSGDHSAYTNSSNPLTGNYKVTWTFGTSNVSGQSTTQDHGLQVGIHQGSISSWNLGHSIWGNDKSTNFYLQTGGALSSGNQNVYASRQKSNQATLSLPLTTSYYLQIVRDSSAETLKLYGHASNSDPYTQSGSLLHTFTGYSGSQDDDLVVATGYPNSNNVNAGTIVANNATIKSGITSLAGATQNNATGSFEGVAITVGASTSSMGAVITYQDNAGTNALNTDIILKLSADNGSNYSTATLTALPDFATGIKMAKVNDLSVTAGTQLKYKIEFANQSSGSKEARIRGVSLQY